MNKIRNPKILIVLGFLGWYFNFITQAQDMPKNQIIITLKTKPK
jgi:hypothetical protein